MPVTKSKDYTVIAVNKSDWAVKAVNADRAVKIYANKDDAEARVH